MYFSYLIIGLTAISTGVAATCSAQTRLADAEQVIYAYNLPDLGASEAAFKTVPWGSPNAAGACLTTIYADGGSPLPVAFTGTGTYDFAVESRQAFSHLTGEYTDFPDNGTVLIDTNVTLGFRNDIPVPVVFNGHVYMDYDENCRIYQARAYAKIPISVLNESFES